MNTTEFVFKQESILTGKYSAAAGETDENSWLDSVDDVDEFHALHGRVVLRKRALQRSQLGVSLNGRFQRAFCCRLTILGKMCMREK